MSRRTLPARSLSRRRWPYMYRAVCLSSLLSCQLFPGCKSHVTFRLMMDAPGLAVVNRGSCPRWWYSSSGSVAAACKGLAAATVRYWRRQAICLLLLRVSVPDGVCCATAPGSTGRVARRGTRGSTVLSTLPMPGLRRQRRSGPIDREQPQSSRVPPAENPCPDRWPRRGPVGSLRLERHYRSGRASRWFEGIPFLQGADHMSGLNVLVGIDWGSCDLPDRRCRRHRSANGLRWAGTRTDRSEGGLVPEAEHRRYGAMVGMRIAPLRFAE